VQLKAADLERTVIYRGVKIEPTMAVGKRSPLARAIRDDLRRGMRGMPLLSARRCSGLGPEGLSLSE
jgi:hypothetical protein